jgi:diadenosine tetraphosphate (Ap4A) HIT family hydrolase
VRIAFLGWGSLVWNPRELKISGTWEKDGPCLPIEFARISDNKRLTLVVYPGAPRVRTLWARAASKDLQSAVNNLAEHERTSVDNIGFVSIPDGSSRCSVTKSILPTIKSWSKQKQLDAVVWTDLPPKFDDFSGLNVLKYLRKLKGRSARDAESYVRNAPPQIRTEIRSILEKELGWTQLRNELDWSELKKDFQGRIIHRSPSDSYWVVVPRDPCTFGHLLIVSWKGHQEQDIADEGLFADNHHLQELMRTAHELAFIMKSCLTSNGAMNGKKCERVYVISACETKGFPFHLHLIPRFECEKTGYVFLFEKELGEARWLSTKDEKNAKVEDGYRRVAEAKAILDYQKWLLAAHRWVKYDDERQGFVERIKKWWSEHQSLKQNSNTHK